MNATLKIGLCALALSAATPGHAEELGRLFFTPQQRAQMDRGKLQNTAPGDNLQVLSVSGIVQKHGGGRTVWINGVPRPTDDTDERAPEKQTVTLPGQSQPITVKVGEKVLLNPPSE